MTSGELFISEGELNFYTRDNDDRPDIYTSVVTITGGVRTRLSFKIVETTDDHHVESKSRLGSIEHTIVLCTAGEKPDPQD